MSGRAQLGSGGSGAAGPEDGRLRLLERRARAALVREGLWLVGGVQSGAVECGRTKRRRLAALLLLLLTLAEGLLMLLVEKSARRYDAGPRSAHTEPVRLCCSNVGGAWVHGEPLLLIPNERAGRVRVLKRRR